MSDTFTTRLLDEYRSQCACLERQYAADRRALLEAYLQAIRDASNVYSAQLALDTQETHDV